MAQTIYLLCNAHIDPVWQWDWEEGAAAAVSTFRSAANLCEQYDALIFNHNEAILYEWVEEYEPALFTRIQRLVAQGKWHIIGGWFLQPDVNLPCGESIFRQIEYGRAYFQEKFGVTPVTAMNVDPFGHSRGIVQIMAKSGYENYLFMRPEKYVPLQDVKTPLLDLPAEDFVWVGYDGSTIQAHRLWEGYLTLMGEATLRIKQKIESSDNNRPELVCWGVGNHGGGPSALDIEQIAQLTKQVQPRGIRLVQSDADAYFRDVRQSMGELAQYAQSLRPSMVGCYSAQIRIKQKHRALEDLLYGTEKLAALAYQNALIAYPQEELQRAQKQLMVAQFHDTLPGTSVQAVEETGLRGLDCGMDILCKVRARAFFALANCLPAAQEEEYPIILFNPFPYDISATIACEYSLANQNWDEDTRNQPVLLHEGVYLPIQEEKECGNIPLDWRKKAVFDATLKAYSLNRFCITHQLMRKQAGSPKLQPKDGAYCVDTGSMQVEIDAQSGLLRKVVVQGKTYIDGLTGRLAVLQDVCDPWGTNIIAYDQVRGYFLPAGRAHCADVFCAQKDADVENCNVIEDGSVRTVIEAVFAYNHSTAILQYAIYKNKPELDISVRLLWMEGDQLVKLCIAPCMDQFSLSAQDIFGVEHYCDEQTTERPMHKWVYANNQTHALGILNDASCAFSRLQNQVAITLLHSPAYTALTINDRPMLPEGRFSSRIDRGERLFGFKLIFGAADAVATQIEAAAQLFNEPPFGLNFFPSTQGDRTIAPLFTLDNPSVRLTSVQKKQDGWSLRLFNASDREQEATLCACDGQSRTISLQPWCVESEVIAMQS